MNKFPLAALALAALLLGIASCGDGGPESRPSSRPEVSADRTSSSPRPSHTEEGRAGEPTRTKATPTRTTDPARAADPARTTEPTRTTELTRTTGPTTKTTAAAAGAGAASSPVAAASTTDDAGGLPLFGWLLIAGFLVALIAVVLIGRSRRAAGWRAESSALADETRTFLDVRVVPVLARRATAEREVSWPPVRDGIAGLVARWAGLSTRAPETAGQASAAQVAGLLQDLVAAVEAESDARATGSDWGPPRAEVDAGLDALTVALEPQPSPGEPGTATYSG
jgi:hypothetical protein